MNKKTGHFWPILCLLLLAPIIGEMLSGSSPPAEYFQLFSFTTLTALYGSGALLVRELARRWGKGWISIFLLGMAYGIYEEGILVRSFFDPTWMDLGILAEYGRTLGVNWIWSIALTLFHGAVSISVPILLIELAFPAHKDVPWLKKGGIIFFSILLLSTLLLSPLLSSRVYPLGILACLACMTALIFFAKNCDFNLRSSDSDKARKPFITFMLFFLLMIAFIFGMFGFPALAMPAWLDFIFLAGLPWLALLLVSYLNAEKWDEQHAWSTAFGLLLPWLFLSVAAEADNAARPDDTSGMSMAALIALISLLVLRVVIQRRWKQRNNNKTG